MAASSSFASRAGASSYSCTLSHRDKGKGRATSPEPISQSRSWTGKESQRSSQRSLGAFDLTFGRSQRSLTSPDLTSEGLSKRPFQSRQAGSSSTSQNVSTTSTTLKGSDSSMAGGEVRLNGVNIDLGDPFSFDPFDNDEQSHRGRLTTAFEKSTSERTMSLVHQEVIDSSTALALDSATPPPSTAIFINNENVSD
jgi:hypothetical protein